VLQCVAVCCSVLPCVAVYCHVLQCIAACLTHFIEQSTRFAVSLGIFFHDVRAHVCAAIGARACVCKDHPRRTLLVCTDTSLYLTPLSWRACLHTYTDAQAISDQTRGDSRCNLKSASILKIRRNFHSIQRRGAVGSSAVCYSVLQSVAACCSVLQRVAACCSVLLIDGEKTCTLEREALCVFLSG